MEDTRFLRPAEAANALNISIWRVRKLLREGKLPGAKLGGRGQWMIPNTELTAYLRDLTAAAARNIKARALG